MSVTVSRTVSPFGAWGIHVGLKTTPIISRTRRMMYLFHTGLSPFFQRRSEASFPSLPAGINTDDSDPLRAGIEACHKAPLSGSVGTPLLGGVAIVSSHFFGSSFSNPNNSGKTQETKEFKECGAATPPRFFMPHPPLCPCGERLAVLSGMKNTPDFTGQTASENRVAR